MGRGRSLILVTEVFYDSMQVLIYAIACMEPVVRGSYQKNFRLRKSATPMAESTADMIIVMRKAWGEC